MVGARRPGGATLAELIVTLFLFSILMTLVLGVYTEGTRVTRRQDKYSASYRRVVGLLEKLEALLEGSRVFRVEQDQVVFAPLPEDGPVRDGQPAWPTLASTVRFDPSDPRPRLWLVEGDAPPRVVLEMERGDRVFFASSEVGVVYVTARSQPPLDGSRQEGLPRTVSSAGDTAPGGSAGLQLTRAIVLESPERY